MLRSSITLAAFLGLASSAGVSAQQRAPDPERAVVQAVMMDFARHVQEGDLAALDSIFSARGHILTDNATTHGWAEYRDKYFKAELARFPGLQYVHAAVEPQVRGDVAWVAFRRELSSNPAGTQAPEHGRGTAVLEKVDGRWRIVHLHVSH